MQLEASLELSPDSLALGEKTILNLRLLSAERSTRPLLIDYAVHYVKANGSLSPKVFKWTERSIKAKGELELKRNHVFRTVTTRRHYPGTHRIEVLVNGRSVASAPINVS